MLDCDGMTRYVKPMNKLDTQTRARILHLLCEGQSIRSITRVMGMSKNTIAKLLTNIEEENRRQVESGVARLQGDRHNVLATLRYKAKHKKSGKTIDSQTAHLWTLKDGKIVAFQQFTDTKQAAAAVR